MKILTMNYQEPFDYLSQKYMSYTPGKTTIDRLDLLDCTFASLFSYSSDGEDEWREEDGVAEW